jgi:hypothetical protein
LRELSNEAVRAETTRDMNLAKYNGLLDWFEQNGFNIDNLEVEVENFITEVQGQAQELLEQISA